MILQAVFADTGERHQRRKTKLTAANRNQMPLFEQRYDRKRSALQRLPEGGHGPRVPLRQVDVQQNYSLLLWTAEENLPANCLITGKNSMGSDRRRRDSADRTCRVRKWPH